MKLFMLRIAVIIGFNIKKLSVIIYLIDYEWNERHKVEITLDNHETDLIVEG